MLVFTLLLTTLLPALATADNVFKVPLSTQLFHVGNLLGLPFKRSEVSGPTQNAVVKVTAPVQCGNNQVFNDVLVDTGSAIFWIGGEKPYVPGPNSKQTNSTFSIGYISGSGASGPLYFDTVTIGEAKGANTFLGAANYSTGFELVAPIDGILGLGPSGSNAGEVSGYQSTPTFVETLRKNNVIQKTVFGIYISPLGANGLAEGSGEITFGGVDKSRTKSHVAWVPQRQPSTLHWEFNVTSMTFGKLSLPDPTYARTDTGTLSISIPFDTYFDMIHNYSASIISDSSALNGYLAFPTTSIPTLPNLDITIGDLTFSIPSTQYVVPRYLYPTLNMTDVPSNVSASWFASGGPGAFMLGQKWLEHAYSVYDMDNHRIGFAQIA